MPSCAGLRAHVELSRISGFIVCETFRVAPRIDNGSVKSMSGIDAALEMLQGWQRQLPPSLHMPDDLSHPDPSCCVLHMAHNQLVVLTTRPVFFAAVKQAVAQRAVQVESPMEKHSQGHYIQSCSKAAHLNLLLAQRITHSSRRLLQAGMHFVFNAAVILLLSRILNSQDVTTGEPNGLNVSEMPTREQIEATIHVAIQTFEDEARTGTIYPRDCFRVLQDLRSLTDRYMASRYPLPDQTNLIDHLQSSQVNTLREYPFDLHSPQQSAGGSDVVHEEMMAWVQSDGLQLHNSLYL